jgi:hypothetical protein
MIRLLDFPFEADNAQATMLVDGKLFYWWPARADGRDIKVLIHDHAIDELMDSDRTDLRSERVRKTLLRHNKMIEGIADQHWHGNKPDIVFLFREHIGPRP